MDSGNVTRLPVRNKLSDEQQLFLVPPPDKTCSHLQASFVIDVDAGKCKCRGCGEEVSAIFVLEQLMKAESRWMRNRERYMDEMKRLNAREKTKCNHCGKITQISRG